MEPTAVLATISGRDRPGVTASLFAALAAHDVEVRDVQQLVIRDRLLLAVLLDIRGELGPLRDAVQRIARALGVEAEVVLAGGAVPQTAGRSTSQVIVMGRVLRPGVIGAIASRITDLGANIDTIAQLAAEPPTMELVVTAVDGTRLRRVLLDACADTGVEMAVRAGDHGRLATRAVLLTVGSIMTGGPTRLERNGPSIEAAEPVQVHPDTIDLVEVLRRFGYRVGLIGAGLAADDPAVDALRLDFVLTSRAPANDPVADVGALSDFAAKFGLPLEQTVVVGTGAADLDLLERAGVGLLANAAIPGVAKARPLLGSLLQVLGIAEHERHCEVTLADPQLRPAGCH
jgi:phosphoserine phosphatase